LSLCINMSPVTDQMNVILLARNSFLKFKCNLLVLVYSKFFFFFFFFFAWQNFEPHTHSANYSIQLFSGSLKSIIFFFFVFAFHL
jgi:hypothetical protein